MRNVKLLLILFIAAFILNGCFEVETVIKLNKNGSGTVEETVLVSQMMVQQMQQMAQGFGGEDTEEDNSNENTMYDIDELKDAAIGKGVGVTYVSSEAIERDGKNGYKVIYRFKDINNLKLSDDPTSKMEMPSMGQETEEGEYLNFNFKKGSNPELTVIFPDAEGDSDGEEFEDYEEELDEEDADMDMSTMAEMNDGMAEMMKQMYSGMKFSTTIVFDGKITKTDASYVDGNTITLLEMDFDKIMENPKAFENLAGINATSPAAAKEAMKNLPGIKVEVSDKISIKFK